MVLVSIITISFNQLEYLPRCIESVASQSYSDFEHIIVDPGSTDGSRSYIQSLDDERYRVDLRSDVGPADGLNHGLDLCRGELMLYLNADDELAPGALETVAKLARQFPKADVFCSNGWLIDEFDRPVRLLRTGRLTKPRAALNLSAMLQQSTAYRLPIRGDLRFNITNRIDWDAEFLWDLVTAGAQIRYSTDIVGYFRTQPASITSSAAINPQVKMAQDALRRRQTGPWRVLGRLEFPARLLRRALHTAFDAIHLPLFPGLARFKHNDAIGVVLSNGFGQFHMSRLAVGLAKRGLLRGFVTGSYPKMNLPSFARRIGPVRRFAERRLDLSRSYIWPSYLSEVPHQLAQATSRVGLVRLAASLRVVASFMYTRRALAALAATNAGVYHYRAGFGGRSVDEARARGLSTVCDHSIVHPDDLHSLIPGTGPHLDAFWRLVRSDIEAADKVVVNSAFVRDSCVRAGVPAKSIFIAQTPVEPSFVTALSRAYEPRTDKLRLVFAGTLEMRKGIDVVLGVAHMSGPIYDWLVVGDWAKDAAHLRNTVPEYISLRPKVSRDDFATILSECDVFLFPTRAEGSARVVAEALTAGCYVVTTEAAGSIVRDGIDGRLVDIGDWANVVDAIDEYSRMSVSERSTRRVATRTYARSELTEDAYVNSVERAYRAGA